MSKARLVITALFVDHQTPAEVAARYGVHRSWVYKLKARYEAEGETALEPRTRRPKTIPTATPPATVELVLRLRKQLTDAGLDAGADTIAWHLHHHHDSPLPGDDQPDPGPRRHRDPRPVQAAEVVLHPVRGRAAQRDLAVRLHPLPADPPRRPPGADSEIITWLDDHSRYALHVSAHARITAPIVLATFRQAGDLHGYPASTLTDNGMVYTVRLAGHGRQGGRTALEAELRRLGITQKNSRPGHPTTCGKAERFQQTMKKWLRAQPDQPTTIAELQTLLDRFREEYNQRRPHRSLEHRSTPATAYTARPKATPGSDQTTETHDRVRRDKINKAGTVTLRVAGQLRHIGIGRTYAGTYVLLLVQDLDVRIVDAATGELLRELTIDPRRDYQPTGRPPGPAQK